VRQKEGTICNLILLSDYMSFIGAYVKSMSKTPFKLDPALSPINSLWDNHFDHVNMVLVHGQQARILKQLVFA